MAGIIEYQGKELFKKYKIPVPEGEIADTPKKAEEIAKKLGKPVVVKMQVLTTGRAGIGGVKICDTPEQAKETTAEMLKREVKNYPVNKVLVEEKLDIQNEMFAGIIIDDRKKMPVLIFSRKGGTGIEEISKKYPDSVVKEYISPSKGLPQYKAREILRKAGIKGKIIGKLASILYKLSQIMKDYNARSIEVNPIIITKDNNVYAADAHIVIDDYAVYKHPDLGIEIAREFPRPPTPLEKIAYNVEKDDYRGTFYFFQMEIEKNHNIYIGFHGAGGGGSMMSMDAVHSQGLKIANFCDTSGNPPASKVYRAAKIILSQPGIYGYFASGSGVASQEQYNSARGFVKAFLEENLDIPAVLRLGGNFEEEAIEILNKYLQNIPGKIEGYGKDDTPEFCTKRLKTLIDENTHKKWKIRQIEDYTPPDNAYSFETLTGKIYIDHSTCAECETKACIDTCNAKVLKLQDGKPILAISEEDAKKGKCTECLGCEIACKFEGKSALHIELPIPGLKEYRANIS